MARDCKTYEEFWPYYLREHAKPTTRALHYAGTTLVIGLGAAAAVTGQAAWSFAMPVAGYSFAWLSHAFVERNKPATFTYPLWSLISDFRMYYCWLTGRLDDELRRAGVPLDTHVTVSG